jgi:hypothetical protein
MINDAKILETYSYELSKISSQSIFIYLMYNLLPESVEDVSVEDLGVLIVHKIVFVLTPI